MNEPNERAEQFKTEIAEMKLKTGRADAESSGINCEGNPTILERIGADRNPIE